MERKCGECSVCCYVGEVPELKKPPHKQCEYVLTNECGSCAIYNSKELPATCRNFLCSWRRGFGSENDRPDENKALFSTIHLENQIYTVVIEMAENAIMTTAKDMAVQMAEAQKLPLIVIKYGVKPPDDVGDYVIIHNSITHRCNKILGEFIEHLDDDVVMYELVKKPLGEFVYKAG
jgi:hypothetical protein